jgi:hypothetical protein
MPYQLAAAIALLSIISLPALGQQVCSLVGTQATLDVASPVLPGTASATVQSGVVEFNPAPGDQRFSVDVEANTVKLYNNDGGTVLFNNATTYTVTFSGPAAPKVTGVSAALNSVSDISTSDVTFTSNSVTFTVTGSSWPGASNVIATLDMTCKPTPPPVAPVPSLGNRNLVLLICLLLAVGVLLVPRRGWR